MTALLCSSFSRLRSTIMMISAEVSIGTENSLKNKRMVDRMHFKCSLVVQDCHWSRCRKYWHVKSNMVSHDLFGWHVSFISFVSFDTVNGSIFYIWSLQRTPFKYRLTIFQNPFLYLYQTCLVYWAVESPLYRIHSNSPIYNQVLKPVIF